jgi:polyhydroxyalkanoate synthesis regulator phasin
MEQFTKNLAGGLRRFAMAGVGAITLTVDKSRELIDQLAARGEVSAAEGQAVCDDLQKKLTDQVSAFTQKLRADYENLSFEQMLSRAQKLSPEQKQRLIDALTKAPEADAANPSAESAAQENSSEESSDKPETFAIEPAPQTASESAEASPNADAPSSADQAQADSEPDDTHSI